MIIQKIFPIAFLYTAFRPFFLFGSFYSLFAIFLWVGILIGYFKNPIKIDSVVWHSYEMIFGFARAIIFGFIFTAGQNWTGKTIIKGRNLAFLVFLWLLGRFSFWNLGEFSYIFWGIDVCSNIITLILLFPKFIVKGQEHNRSMLFLSFLFTILHITIGFNIFSERLGNVNLYLIHISLFVVLNFISIIAGRIVPFFTRVVVTNYDYHASETIDEIINQSSFLFLFSELIVFWIEDLTVFAGIFSIFMGIIHLIRFFNWKPWKSVSFPILWILYLGYFWLVLGFFFYGTTHFNIFPTSSAIHMFSIGAIGVFIYGMLTRVSLGHTGRKIVASPLTIFAYFSLNIAVFIRVILPLLHDYKNAYLWSGSLWVVAFLAFVFQYFKILTSPRPDGKLS